MGQQLATTTSGALHSWSTKADAPSQSGKNVVVTGANSGIGYVTARELGRLGARVFCLCRDPKRGHDAVDALGKDVPHGRFELVLTDLASLASVKNAAGEVVCKLDGEPLHTLVNNAGVMMMPKRQETADGFEMQMGTNHLGHFALTGALLPSLQKAEQPRVVNVSSLMAWTGNFKSDAAFDFTVPESTYSPLRCYGNSKLANLIFTREMARRYPKITVVAAHPGGSQTNLQQHAFNDPITKMLLQRADVGALPSLKAATVPGLPSASYFGPWLFGMMGAPSQFNAVMPPQAGNAEIGSRFWMASVQATGVKF